MRIMSVIVVALLCSGICAQNFTAAHIETVFSDASRGNRKVPVQIFYPERVPGTESGISSSDDNMFPVICFAHGYMLPASAYMNILEALVAEGYILVFPESASGLFPSHGEYSKDLAFVLSEIDRLAGDTSSALYGIAGTVRCLMGHSMGGGALFAAANMCTDLSAVVALAPFNTTPSAIQAASSVRVPALVFAGSNDCITPPENHQLPIYNFSAAREKTYILIKGGTHCQMGSHSQLCSFGETIALCKDGISQEEQHRILNRYLLPWLNFFLKGDTESGIEFDDRIRYDTSVEYLRSSPLVTAEEMCNSIF